jgi:hypothetical protein
VNANFIVVDVVDVDDAGALLADVPSLARSLPDQLPVLLKEQTGASPRF